MIATVRAADVISLVKLEHTVFALPFAYAGMLLATIGAPVTLTPTLVLWVTLAMVGARTLAMALNRLVDADIDARNPRTAMRELPSGRMSSAQVVGVCVAAGGLLAVAVSQLHPITWYLAPVPVLLFVVYPYTKRFTWACHLVLGVTIGLAPLAAWLAVTGSAPLAAWLLLLASATWIAGFDIIYATGDVDFDREEGLHSLPARLGVARALQVTRLLHVVTVLALVATGIAADLGAGYHVGVAVVGALLAYENAIVRPHDLSRVNAAFFTVNGVVGIVFLVAVIAGAWRA